MMIKNRLSKCYFSYTTRGFGWNFLPQKVGDFDNTKFATMQPNIHYTLILSQNHYNILKIQYYFNRNIANILMPCISCNFYPRNTVKYGPQIEFMTKHNMFSWKVYPSPENFTQLLVKMVRTFYMSAETLTGVKGWKPVDVALWLSENGEGLLPPWLGYPF